MKTLAILALAALVATSLVTTLVMAAGPADSGQAGACGAVFEIRDPELRARFAQEDRDRDREFAEICAAHRTDFMARSTGR